MCQPRCAASPSERRPLLPLSHPHVRLCIFQQRGHARPRHLLHDRRLHLARAHVGYARQAPHAVQPARALGKSGEERVRPAPALGARDCARTAAGGAWTPPARQSAPRRPAAAAAPSPQSTPPPCWPARQRPAPSEGESRAVGKRGVLDVCKYDAGAGRHLRSDGHIILSCQCQQGRCHLHVPKVAPAVWGVACRAGMVTPERSALCPLRACRVCAAPPEQLGAPRQRAHAKAGRRAHCGRTGFPQRCSNLRKDLAVHQLAPVLLLVSAERAERPQRALAQPRGAGGVPAAGAGVQQPVEPPPTHAHSSQQQQQLPRAPHKRRELGNRVGIGGSTLQFLALVHERAQQACSKRATSSRAASDPGTRAVPDEPKARAAPGTSSLTSASPSSLTSTGSTACCSSCLRCRLPGRRCWQRVVRQRHAV